MGAALQFLSVLFEGLEAFTEMIQAVHTRVLPGLAAGIVQAYHVVQR
jgi:hypothetical protein